MTATRLADGDRPLLPRGVRLHWDKRRGTSVLLAPERALVLDASGEAILSRLDGRRSLREIAEDLAAAHDATPAQVLADMKAFLTALVERRMVDLTP
ncbi:MAG: pyrroloquinoline quinone biosynthesis peptide chaperone PqqD [Rhodospirillales bacterium]